MEESTPIIKFTKTHMTCPANIHGGWRRVASSVHHYSNNMRATTCCCVENCEGQGLERGGEEYNKTESDTDLFWGEGEGGEESIPFS